MTRPPQGVNPSATSECRLLTIGSQPASLPMINRDLYRRGVKRVQKFVIPVRNEFTGEVRLVEVVSGYYADAQVEALHVLFKREGWRKATALHATHDVDLIVATL